MEEFADALFALAEWIETSDWAETYGEFCEDFAEDFQSAFGPPMYEYMDGMDEDLQELVNLCLMEDFVFYQDEQILDEYAENTEVPPTPSQLEFVRALQNAVCSVFEVAKLSHDDHVEFKDVFRKNATYKTRIPEAKTFLTKGDLIRAKFILVEGKTIMTQGMVGVPPQAMRQLEDMRKEAFLAYKEQSTAEELADPEYLADLVEWGIEDALDGALTGWIAINGPDEAFEKLQNSMEAELAEVISNGYSLSLTGSEIDLILNEHPDFRLELDDTWSWLEMQKGELVVSGSLMVVEDTLITACFSSKKSKRLAERLSQLFGKKIGKPQKIKP